MKALNEPQIIKDTDLNFTYNDIRTSNECEEYFDNEGNDIKFFKDILVSIEKILNDGMQYNRNESTIVGLMVKVYKLYSIILRAYTEKQFEIICWLVRPLIETCVNSQYLILKGDDLQLRFRLIGYKLRYQLHKEWEVCDRPIGKRLLTYFKENLKLDGFTIEDLENVDNKKNKEGKPHKKRWELTNGNFKSILNEVYPDKEYADFIYNNIYSGFSESIHASYLDIFQHNLCFIIDGKFDKRYAKLDFYDGSNLTYINNIVRIILDACISFQDFKNRFEEMPNMIEYQRICNLISKRSYEDVNSFFKANN